MPAGLFRHSPKPEREKPDATCPIDRESRFNPAQAPMPHHMREFAGKSKRIIVQCSNLPALMPLELKITICDIHDVKRVILLPAAAKDLRRHRADAERLVAKIEAYAKTPETQVNNIKSLKGSTARRLRVGDFRIVFEETVEEIIVTRIAPRGSVYD
jgi:mRNA interferase RelE/StbE